MKHIKDGKLVLDGTIRECDLQENLNTVLELIVDKNINPILLKNCRSASEYNCKREDRRGCSKITLRQFFLLKDYVKWKY